MTARYNFADDIDSDEPFRRTLEQLVAAADENDLDIRGSWLIDGTDPDEPDWEVMVYHLDNSGRTD